MQTVRVSTDGSDMALEINRVEKYEDGYRVWARHPSSPAWHALLVRDLAGSYTVSHGKEPGMADDAQAIVRIARDERGYRLRAIRTSEEDDVSGHAVAEIVFQATVDSDDDVEGHGMVGLALAAATAIGLAAAAGFIVVMQLASSSAASPVVADFVDLCARCA